MFDVDMMSILTLILVFLYCILGCACLFQILRLVYYRHSLRSFQFWFLFICFTWSVLRVVFFLFSNKMAGRMKMIIYWMPADLQFITFSLLVLFYAFILYQHSWASVRVSFFIVYFSVNLSVCLTTLLYIFIGCDRSNCGNASLNKIHHMYLAFQLTILVMVYAYFSWRLYRSCYSTRLPWSTTPGMLYSLTLTSLLVFVSRWLYNILVAINSEKFGLQITTGSDGMIDIRPQVFGLFFIWEVLPSLLVLFFFRDIPSTDDTVLHCLFPGLKYKSKSRVSDDFLYNSENACVCSHFINDSYFSLDSRCGAFFRFLCQVKVTRIGDGDGDDNYVPPNIIVGTSTSNGEYSPLDELFPDSDPFSKPGYDSYNNFNLFNTYNTYAIPTTQSGGGVHASQLVFDHANGGVDAEGQTMEDHIQAHIQAQLEHHARQGEYY